MTKTLARVAALALVSIGGVSAGEERASPAAPDSVQFSVRSVRTGDWSNASTWSPARVPGSGDRVLVAGGTTVRYDVTSSAVLRLVQVVGVLEFARDRDTELNVGLLKIQNSDACRENGFACDFHGVNEAGEPQIGPSSRRPALIVGTPENPIPPDRTAKIRLHFVEGMNADDAPALACCSARMELHGAPLRRTWTKLDRDVQPGASRVRVAADVSDWRVGDEVIVTGTHRSDGFGSFRPGARRERKAQTERRRVATVDGTELVLDAPLKFEHSGSGEFRSEVANLSRSVVVESADPNGVRGHTVYHRFSRGSVSYARFAHLGKEGVLGRYAIHFHVVGDTMRGSSVVGAAIVDSHNRWITVHGTDYLIVRDCVGYGSVGHGFFLEDGSEVYNLFERNLGVHAYRGERLPKQVLGFDPNDGAAFWWANGRNTFVRNVAVENDEYGFRYDMQKTSRFDSEIFVAHPSGGTQRVDVRTIPIWRFEDNEAHGNFAGMVVAANGGRQPDAPIRDAGMLRRIRSIDWTGPDRRHPHVIRGFKIWESHYAFRPQSPSMLMEGIRIDRAAYGIYRPAFDNHVYRQLRMSRVGPEPFNRGMDDASAQFGSITVDGFVIDDLGRGNDRHPYVHMTDNALAAGAECHFRGIEIKSAAGKRPLFNRGGSVRADPFVERGVPYYVHDHFGPGRDARIVSAKAVDLLADGKAYREERPLTGDESRIAEVGDVEWPELLDPVDDLPPATVITSTAREGSRLRVRGVSHDNGEITSVVVSGSRAKLSAKGGGIYDWIATIDVPSSGAVVARATDKAGNVEQTPHRVDTPLLASANAGTKIRVAAISFVPKKFGLDENADTLERAYRDAAAGGAQLAVAPEGALDGYVVNEIIAGDEPSARMNEVAIALDGPVIRRFRTLARELAMCLVFGFAERENGDVFNCAVFIDDRGKIRGKYHKMQFAEGYDSAWWFNRLGRRSRSFETPFGRCGILICNDRWNPDLARIPVLDGARFLIVPAFGSRAKTQDDAVLSRARENDVPIVEANVGVGLVIDGGEIQSVARDEVAIVHGEITVPPPTASRPGERDGVERKFLDWRRGEMERRLAKTMDRIREKRSKAASEAKARSASN